MTKITCLILPQARGTFSLTIRLLRGLQLVPPTGEETQCIYLLRALIRLPTFPRSTHPPLHPIQLTFQRLRRALRHSSPPLTSSALSPARHSPRPYPRNLQLLRAMRPWILLLRASPRRGTSAGMTAPNPFRLKIVWSECPPLLTQASTAPAAILQ